MAMTDEDVLKRLREIHAMSVGGGKGSGRGGPSRVLAADAGGPRRSDGEVARAILAIELALSSPAMQAVLEADGSVTPTAKTKGKGKATALAPAGAAAVAADSSFCQIYAEIKDYIDIAMEALDWVPYGTTIAKVLRLLEKFADRACRPAPKAS